MLAFAAHAQSASSESKTLILETKHNDEVVKVYRMKGSFEWECGPVRIEVGDPKTEAGIHTTLIAKRDGVTIAIPAGRVDYAFLRRGGWKLLLPIDNPPRALLNGDRSTGKTYHAAVEAVALTWFPCEGGGSKDAQEKIVLAALAAVDETIGKKKKEMVVKNGARERPIAISSPGAEGGDRTHKASRPRDFESRMVTGFITSAGTAILPPASMKKKGPRRGPFLMSITASARHSGRASAPGFPPSASR